MKNACYIIFINIKITYHCTCMFSPVEKRCQCIETKEKTIYVIGISERWDYAYIIHGKFCFTNSWQKPCISCYFLKK